MSPAAEIDKFTVGRDRELDVWLAPFDVLGSMAHATMLESIGLLESEELQLLLAELKEIYSLCERGEFAIEDDVEDVHSQVELMLTRRLGDVGKKIHSGRSRNDQVAVDVRLHMKSEIVQTEKEVCALAAEQTSSSIASTTSSFFMIIPSLILTV